MIGGADLWLSGAADAVDKSFINLLMAAEWPSSVVEHDGADHFYYQSAGARALWKAQGRTETAAARLVVVRFDAEGIAFVVDDAASSSGQLVARLIENLRQNRRLGGREPGHAA